MGSMELRRPEEERPKKLEPKPSELLAIPKLRDETGRALADNVKRAAGVAAMARDPFLTLERRSGSPVIDQWLTSETRDLLSLLANKKVPVEAVQFAQG